MALENDVEQYVFLMDFSSELFYLDSHTSFFFVT